MQINKLVAVALLGTALTACMEVKNQAPVVGDTYSPKAESNLGSYKVIMDGKKKMLITETDVDVISKDARCCDDEMPKEIAILRTNKEIEVRVGDYSPNIQLTNIRGHCEGDNYEKLVVDIDYQVSHSAGTNMNLPSVEMPIFLAAANLSSQEVYDRIHGMVVVDMNAPFEEKTARMVFDMSDLKARNLKDWTLVSGIMISEANREFMKQVQWNKQHALVEGHINKSAANIDLGQNVRGSENYAPDLIVK